jgi:uncharacterized protein (TIGR02453 family)
VTFRGFPAEAFELYSGLEADNSKAYWAAHKDVYERAVKQPMLALAEAVPEEMRPMRMFRPYRDVRFAADKTPYKTHAGMVGEREGGAAFYVQLSAKGLFAGSGYYHMANDQLARFREAVDDDGTGVHLVALLAERTKAGCVVGAVDELKTAPRGYAKDHPRIALLRRKGLFVGREWAPAAWTHTAKVLTRLEALWRESAPVNDWLDAHVGPSELPPDDH